MRQELFNAFLQFSTGSLLAVGLFRYIFYTVFIKKKSKYIRRIQKSSSFNERLFFIKFKNNIPNWLYYLHASYILLLPCYLIIFFSSFLFTPLIVVVVWFTRLKATFDAFVLFSCFIYELCSAIFNWNQR